MSEDKRTDIVNPDAEPPKASTSGPADLTYGAAEPGEGRPDAADRDDELAPAPDVHGEEGGGDPAAGAEEDATEEDDDERPRPRGFTP